VQWERLFETRGAFEPRWEKGSQGGVISGGRWQTPPSSQETLELRSVTFKLWAIPATFV